MIKTYIKIAWRNMLRHRSYSLLNIAGLALGIAATFVLFLFVKQELSYEKHFEHSEKIYRIASDFYNMGGFARSSEALLGWLKEDCKEVRMVTGVNSYDKNFPVEVDGAEFIEKKAIVVDSNFFRMFSFDLIEGNPRHLFKGADEVVLTDKLAKKYFGRASAIGETILIGKEKKTIQRCRSC